MPDTYGVLTALTPIPLTKVGTVKGFTSIPYKHTPDMGLTNQDNLLHFILILNEVTTVVLTFINTKLITNTSTDV